MKINTNKTYKRITSSVLAFLMVFSSGGAALENAGINIFGDTIVANATDINSDIAGIITSSCVSSYITETFAYTGCEVQPGFTVTVDGRTLTKDVDYTETYSDNVDVGVASCTITGIGSYSGSVKRTFEITQQSIDDKNVEINVADGQYYADWSGTNNCEPEVIITSPVYDPQIKDSRTMTLVKDADYTVSYSNNTYPGTVAITIKGINNYSGTVTKTLEILEEQTPVVTDISTCTVALPSSVYTYDGTAKTPTVTVKDGSTTLTNGIDYTVTYQNNINVGTATAIITGEGNYTGTISQTFTITEPEIVDPEPTATNISDMTITLSAENYTYDGNGKEPDVIIKNDSETLIRGRDFLAYYDDNINVGTITVTIIGVGNYEGTVIKTFKINAASINSATATLSTASYTYDGTTKKPTVTVKLGTKTLVNNTDYTVSYKNNTNIGTATVTITAKGNYTGKMTKTFTIYPENVTGIKASSITSNSLELTWNKVKGATDYYVYRYDATAKKWVKLDSAKSNSYKATKLSAGTSHVFAVKAYRTVNDEDVLSKSFTEYNTVTIPSKSSFSTDYTGLYNIKPTWNKVKGVSGYEISIYKDGKWVKSKTTSLSKNFKGLRSHVKYKLRLRTYKEINGKNYYSDYVTKEFWTDSKLKGYYAYNIYTKKNTSSKVIKYMGSGQVVQQKGSPSNGWTKVYIPGTDKKQTGYIRTNNMYYYANLSLTAINQNSYAGGTIAPLGCEETSLASVLKNQYGFNVTKNILIDKYMPMASFKWSDGRYQISVDPNYAFLGSPYHYREPDGNGYGVYAPVIAQSAYKYLRDQNQQDNYQIELHTDYYTGNNPNGIKFDPSKLTLGNTNITGGLDLNGIKAELEKGHNVIVWYNVASYPYVSKTQVLKKGTAYTNSGTGTYKFDWYAHQHTAVITGYDNANKRFIISNVWNNNSSSYTGTTTYINYNTFMNGYTKLGRQSVVVYKK